MTTFGEQKTAFDRALNETERANLPAAIARNPLPERRPDRVSNLADEVRKAFLGYVEGQTGKQNLSEVDATELNNLWTTWRDWAQAHVTDDLPPEEKADADGSPSAGPATPRSDDLRASDDDISSGDVSEASSDEEPKGPEGQPVVNRPRATRTHTLYPLRTKVMNAAKDKGARTRIIQRGQKFEFFNNGEKTASGGQIIGHVMLSGNTVKAILRESLDPAFRKVLKATLEAQTGLKASIQEVGSAELDPAVNVAQTLALKQRLKAPARKEKVIPHELVTECQAHNKTQIKTAPLNVDVKFIWFESSNVFLVCLNSAALEQKIAPYRTSGKTFMLKRDPKYKKMWIEGDGGAHRLKNYRKAMEYIRHEVKAAGEDIAIRT